MIDRKRVGGRYATSRIVSVYWLNISVRSERSATVEILMGYDVKEYQDVVRKSVRFLLHNPSLHDKIAQRSRFFFFFFRLPARTHRNCEMPPRSTRVRRNPSGSESQAKPASEEAVGGRKKEAEWDGNAQAGIDNQ